MGETLPFHMAKIRYLQRTHDSLPGDKKIVNGQYAKVLILLHKTEYVTGKKADGSKKKEVNVENG